MTHPKALLIPTLAFALVVQACSSNRVVVSTPTSTIVVAPTVTTLPGTSEHNPIPAGSAVSADQMKFVITGTVRPADGIVSAGDMYNPQPIEYHHYVFVTLSVTCETAPDQQCQLDLFKMKLLGSDGITKYPERFLSGVKGILNDTDFQGGQTVSGYVPFIISIGASRLQLIYELPSGDSFYLALP